MERTRHPRQFSSYVALFAVALVAWHWLGWPIGTVAQVTPPGILWSADHEEGTLADWDRDDGGGEFNSGNGDSAVTPGFAHSGVFSVRQVIVMVGYAANGTRLFRWDEADAYPEAYYSVWYFFPQRYSVGSWWNLFQFKSKSADGLRNDPFWQLNVWNRPSGEMYLYPYNWVNSGAYPQTTADLPVGRWVHVEAFLRQSDAGAGRLTVWQDGVQIFDIEGITTKYPGGRQDWSINNYGDGISPTSVVTYVDNATISSVRVGPGGGIVPPATATPPPVTATATPPPATATAVPTGSRIDVHAAGSASADGVYPTMELRIDDRAVRTWANVNGNPTTRPFPVYSYTHSSPVTADRVKIAFVNDKYVSDDDDRVLRVDKLVIDGVAYESEAPATYSVGSWTAETGCTPGYKKREWLDCDGFFAYGQAVPATATVPTATPTTAPATATLVTATATVTRPPATATVTACSPRAPIELSTTRKSARRLEVRVVAPTTPSLPTNRLRGLRIQETINATVDVRTHSGASGSFFVDLADGPSELVFYVNRDAPNRPTTVRMTLVDDCGPWPTFVGDGAS